MGKEDLSLLPLGQGRSLAKAKLLPRKVAAGCDSSSTLGSIVEKVKGSLGLPFFCHECLLRMLLIKCQQVYFFDYKIKYHLCQVFFPDRWGGKGWYWGTC